jgi:phenylalanine-4-hydroxylase
MNAQPQRVQHQQTDKGVVPVYTTAVVEQPWEDYTETDHKVWQQLFARQRELLKGRACQATLAAQENLHMTADAIPKFTELNAILSDATGWQLIGVEGLLPEETFFEHLANRRFPVTWWIRQPDQLDYIS